MKALSRNQLEIYVSHLNEKMSSRHIASPILYTEKAIFFHLSGKEYERFSIVLEEEAPRLYLAKENVGATSSSSHFFDQFKKELINPYVENVTVLEGDRIIKFTLYVINNVFKEEKKNLYLELIPHHPNLIITDKDENILLSYRSGHLGDERPLLKGMKYLPPKNTISPTISASFDVFAYENACLEEEKALGEKRKNDKFSYLIKSLKNRKKLLERKIIALSKDEEEAKKHLDDGTYGDAIYMSLNEIPQKASSFIYEGMEIKLDPSKSASSNATLYYKKAKKAKATLSLAKEHKEAAEKELLELDVSLNSLMHADEAGLELLAKDLDLAIISQSKKKHNDKWNGLSTASLPYYISYKGSKILYGKNAKQNDCLTFLFETAKDHAWLHIANGHGSHVIIKKDNPDEEDIKIAAELVIALAGKKDGEVMVASRKDIRKGSEKGEVIVKKFKTIRVNEVSKITKELLKEERRYSF